MVRAKGLLFLVIDSALRTSCPKGLASSPAAFIGLRLVFNTIARALAATTAATR